MNALPLRMLVRANQSSLRLWNMRHRREDVDRLTVLVPEILATIPQSRRSPAREAWQLGRVHRTDTGMMVATLGPAGHPPEAILRLAPRAADAERLRRQSEALVTLHGDERLGVWRDLLPGQLALGTIERYSFAVEQRVAGHPGTAFLRETMARERVLRVAVAAITVLHRSTTTLTVVTSELLELWLDRRLRLIAPLIAAQTSRATYTASLTRLADYVREALLGRRLAVGWIHGDYWLGNILTTQDGMTINGIVDWEWASDNELPAHDFLHLRLYTRCLVEHRDLGRILCEILGDAAALAQESGVLGESLGEVLDRDVTRAMLLLYWLRHVTANLEQSAAYITNRRWFKNSVASVLALF